MTKYTLVVVAFFIVLTSTMAQDKSSTSKFLIGGTINYQSRVLHNSNPKSNDPVNSIEFFDIADHVDFYESRQFFASLYTGIHISENSLIGLTGNISSFVSDNVQQPEFGIRISSVNDKSFGFGLFYRQYINTKTPLRLYIQPTFSVAKNKRSFEIEDLIFSDNSNTLRYIGSLNLGLVYSVNKNWNVLLDLTSVRFERYKTTDQMDVEQVTTGSDLYFNFDLSSINFGLEYLF